mmetsp:Transcript_47887/g.113804  ORF Transcript_47887/g.113804 Transcript_47887/m.113804 type:complete len:416 (+) Transcript_47887:116-1363(+)
MTTSAGCFSWLSVCAGLTVSDSVRAAPHCIGKYKLGPPIGQGLTGTVNAAENLLTGKKVAMKVVAKSKIAPQSLQEEIDNLRALSDHEHIVKIFDVIEKPQTTFIAMEFAPSNLSDYLVKNNGPLQEHEAKRLFAQVASAVRHCHKCYVAHRDLKPENILLDKNNNVKLADFGFSANVSAGKPLNRKCGTPSYVAPELLGNGVYDGLKADVWSCGVLLYVLLCGERPFQADSVKAVLQKVKSCDYTMPCHISKAAQDLLSQMLELVPELRLTLSEVLMHYWLHVAAVAAAATSSEHKLDVDSLASGQKNKSFNSPSQQQAQEQQQPLHTTNQRKMQSLRFPEADVSVKGNDSLLVDSIGSTCSCWSDDDEGSFTTPPMLGSKTPPSSEKGDNSVGCNSTRLIMDLPSRLFRLSVA